MIATLAERPRFHRQLMLRVASEEEAPSRRLWRLVAAAILVLVGSALAYVMLSRFSGFEPQNTSSQHIMTPSPEGPGAEKPLALSQADEEEQSPLPANAETDTSNEEPPDEALELTRLPLILAGTTGGVRPTAVITRTTDDVQRVYAVGDSPLAGVQLVEVADRHVLLDNAGSLEVLAFPDAPAVTAAPPLDGLWTSAALADNKVEQGPVFRVASSGTTLTAASVSGTPDRFSGTLYGDRIVVSATEGPSGPLTAEGTVNEERSEITLKTSDPELGTIVLKKIDDEEAALQAALPALKDEVLAMYNTLASYARRHEGRFPDDLAALVPSNVPDLSRFADTEMRTVTYYPGARLPANDDVGALSSEAFASFRSDLPYPDRLMLWEERLGEEFGEDALLREGQTVLRAAYTSPEVVLLARVGGKIDQEGEAQAGPLPAPTTPAERLRLDAARHSCQNNLKQLGLVVYIFKAKHEGYTPPGWFSTYPECLPDMSILTSPKDAPGTDSYVYLFPATNLDAMAREALGDDENPAAKAKFLSEMPLILNRSDFPGDTPGRNVLFADGHVEYVRSPQWREVIEPWLSQSGVSVP